MMECPGRGLGFLHALFHAGLCRILGFKKTHRAALPLPTYDH